MKPANRARCAPYVLAEYPLFFALYSGLCREASGHAPSDTQTYDCGSEKEVKKLEALLWARGYTLKQLQEWGYELGECTVEGRFRPSVTSTFPAGLDGLARPVIDALV